MAHAPYKFTPVRELDMGYHLESDDPDVWPRFGGVYLMVEPLPRGYGTEFIHLPRAAADHRSARLPRWAVDHAELGALHGLMVGGPGGIPITDVRVKLLSGSWKPTESGERVFFLCAYLAVRKAIHKAIMECPCFLEYVERAHFVMHETDEKGTYRELHERRASSIDTRRVEGVADQLEFEADVPAALQDGMEQALGKVDAHFHRVAPAVRWESVGYRSRELTDVPSLLKSFGPPPDWPEPGTDDPLLNGSFPALPQPKPRHEVRSRETLDALEPYDAYARGDIPA